MPSMTTMGIGLDMNSLSYQRLSAWARARLDACLSESLRQSSPVELSRARLLVGILGMLLLLDLLVLLFFSARQQRPWLAGAIELLCLVAFLGMLWSLRRVSSIRLPALGVCSFVSLAMMLEAHRSGSQAVAVNVMTMLVPMLTVYLLGVRWGLFFSVLSATYMGLVHPQAFPPSNNLGLNLFSALFLLCGWLVSWMFLASRDEAHAALERALRTMHESERKLISLVESTDDPVCSLDTRGRVLTFNHAGHELCRQLFGGEPPRNTALFDMLAPEQRALWKERVERTLDGQRVRFQVDTVTRGQTRVMDISLNPILGSHGHPVGMTLFGRDITALKEAEARLGELHRNLMDVSRRAGMAEMATGILHNVGNTLNSVNVSAGLISERLRGLRVSGVARAAGLLREHAHDLATFFASDSRGRQIPAYMETLAQQLSADQEALLAEARSLHQSIDHIKAVVSMQQRHARCTEVLERIPVPRLLDDALRLNAVSFERLGIQVSTEYASVEPVLVDRHKLLQVLLNLLSNARHALLASDRTDKQLSLRVAQSCPGRLRIEVADNGVGVSPENMRRLFTQGFTTKKNGHGFGLHISALAATEMGGALTCRSEGRGLGATFTVELPFEGKEAPRLTPPVGYRTWDGSSGTTHR